MKLLLHIMDAAIAGILAFILITIANVYVPRIDGYFNPVAKATSIEFYIENGTRKIRGKMEKYRDCNYISMSAFVINTLTGEKIAATLEVGSTVKRYSKGGNFSWGPWVIGTPAWNSDMKLRVYNTHRCNQFFVTRTEFFEKEISYFDWRNGLTMNGVNPTKPLPVLVGETSAVWPLSPDN